MSNSNRYANSSDERFQEIHAACEALEQSLQNKEPIRIDDGVAAVSEDIRTPLFRELRTIELERQVPCDRPSQFDEYHAGLPDRNDDIERVFQEISMAWSAADDLPEKIGTTDPERRPVSATVPVYEIEGVLGRGAEGVVYTARHLKLKRRVALKMVLAGGPAADVYPPGAIPYDCRPSRYSAAQP